MGKPAQEVKKKQDFKSPVSKFWLGMCSISEKRRMSLD
jgi:hypothetical protein